MPTTDSGRRLRLDAAAALVAEIAFAAGGLDDQRGVGLEVELLPMSRRADRWQRAAREDSADRLDRLAAEGPVVAPRLDDGPLAAWPAGSGRLTFEPGGQVEYSGGPHGDAAGALADAERVLGALAASWDAEGDVLASVGVDPWSDLDEVPQQLAAGRYQAMDAYLSARGGAGRRMMRHTCALQVNLDPGTGEVARLRWQVANLAAAVTTATFACAPASPPDPAVSVRARAWRRLDPTRTGVPHPGRLLEQGPPAAAYAQWALDADVLLFRLPDGGAAPGRPGLSFRRWAEEGDDRHGWPTADDLRQHVSTLFPEVRPRGPLELRSVDALPARWRAVPVVLLTGLLYDDRALRLARDLLAHQVGHLPADLARAGESGLKDPEVCALAVELWSFARAGAARLGPGWHRQADLDATDAFVDRLVLRGRCPADELRDRLADDPDAALRWAAEPATDPVSVERR